MKKITLEQFLVRQPMFPEQMPADEYYYRLSNHILNRLAGLKSIVSFPERGIRRMVLTCVGYYQDVICDAGVWRSFIGLCRKLYGRPVPFFAVSDDYLEAELNYEDIRFLVWYAIAMNCETMRRIDPFDTRLEDFSGIIYEELENRYENAPEPEGYNLAREIDLSNPEDARNIYRFGNWLFMHCYLMTPAYSQTLSEMADGLDMGNPDHLHELREKLEKSMINDPTGPLALYSREWIYLIAEDRLPDELVKTSDASDVEPHPYYIRFMESTSGCPVKFFDSYDKMNSFFIDALGWEKGERHLSQLEDSHDFVLMVNRQKGLLVARDIARAIAAPSNHLYDKTWASSNAIDLLTNRGCCPVDLLKYLCSQGWIPDAAFPGGSCKTVSDNSDFIARCYLQQYYRGD